MRVRTAGGGTAAAGNCGAAGFARRGGRGAGSAGVAREAHGEDGAAAFAGAVGADLAAVEFDDVPHDRQPDPQSAVRSRAGAVGLAEAVEDVGEELGVDAGAVVL